MRLNFRVWIFSLIKSKCLVISFIEKNRRKKWKETKSLNVAIIMVIMHDTPYSCYLVAYAMTHLLTLRTSSKYPVLCVLQITCELWKLIIIIIRNSSIDKVELFFYFQLGFFSTLSVWLCVICVNSPDMSLVHTQWPMTFNT